MIDANYDKRRFYIATVDNHETTIYGENKAAVIAVAEDLIKLVREQIGDNSHYGLAFLFSNQNIYGGGEIIALDADKKQIWYLIHHHMDGDNWAANNVYLDNAKKHPWSF